MHACTIRMCLYVCMYVCTYVCMCEPMCVCVNLYMYVGMHICVCVCMWLYMYMYICVYNKYVWYVCSMYNAGLFVTVRAGTAYQHLFFKVNKKIIIMYITCINE